METEIIEKYYVQAVLPLGADESIILDFDKWTKFFSGLPIKQQVVYSVSILDWQVNNGGLHQYFFNPYGIFSYATIPHLKRIGRLDFAELLNRAINIVNPYEEPEGIFLRELFNRQVELISDFDDSTGEMLDKLDDHYYQLNENNHILKALAKYLDQ